eukprot:4869734-Pyramimonas_sp.AAC.1
MGEPTATLVVFLFALGRPFTPAAVSFVEMEGSAVSACGGSHSRCTSPASLLARDPATLTPSCVLQNVCGWGTNCSFPVRMEDQGCTTSRRVQCSTGAPEDMHCSRIP